MLSALSKHSDVMAKEGHVNDDISDVPVEVCAAPMTGRGWYSLVLAAPGMSSMAALQTPYQHAIEGRQHDMRSLGRGVGILGWRVYLALSQEDTTDGKGDGSVVIVTIFFGCCGSIFTPWECQTPGFCDVVACASDTPIQLHCQNYDKTQTS